MGHPTRGRGNAVTSNTLSEVMFIGNQPWMQVRSFSVMKPAADLALILTSKITGAMAAASYTVVGEGSSDRGIRRKARAGHV
jgi:hypothetical protein